MSSIDQETLRRFFSGTLAEVARALRRRRYVAFPSGPDEDAESWYVDVDPDAPTFVTVEVAELEAELCRMWEAEGLPELAGITRDLLQMAEALQVDEDESAEISPFLYVMY